MPSGWRFVRPDEKLPGDHVTPDPIHNCTHLRDIYFKVDPDYHGRFTVPTLYDVKQGKIVSNEVGHPCGRDLVPFFRASGSQKLML